MASWCGSLGACLPFVPFLFLWSSLSLQGLWTGSWRGSSHRVVSSLSFGVALPLLCRWRAREAESCGPIRSSGRLPGAYSSLSSSPLSLPGVVMAFPVCLPRAPALRQGLVAMLAEGALESPSVLVLAFHSSLFLVEGSSDGSAPGDRFLSPGRMCSSLRFSCDQSLLRCLSWGVGFSSSSGSVGLLSDPVAPFLEESFGVPVRVGSSSSLHGEFCLTLFLSFLGCSHPGLVGFLPLPGVTSPVWSPGRFWLLGARSHFASPLCSLAPSFSGVGAVRMTVSPLFPHLVRRAFVYDLTVSPLLHYRWSLIHGQASAGLIC